MTRSPQEWLNLFIKKCIQVPGQGVLITGRPGSGKTTVLYWLVDLFRMYTRETLVWFDMMKSSEALTLLTMGPVRFIVPPDCKLLLNLKIETFKVKDQTNYRLHEYEIVTMKDILDPWPDIRGPDLNPDGSIKQSWINVICLEAYLIEPDVYAMVVSEVFKKLIRRALHKQVISPMTIFIDEFHNLAPAQGHELSKLHTRAALFIQRNTEKLRSLGIRLNGSTQGLNKIRRGVRGCFDWHVPKRGANFEFSDEPKLFRFNGKFGSLQDRELIIVFPDRQMSDPLLIKATDDDDYYPKGEWIGTMDYIGEIELEKKNKRTQEAEA